MHGFLDHDFLTATTIGLGGVLTWLLSTWADPSDDTVGGSLKHIFWTHSRSTLVSVLTYLGVCVTLHEMEQLTVAGAFTAGYMGQSLATKVFSARAAKMGNGGPHGTGGSPAGN